MSSANSVSSHCTQYSQPTIVLLGCWAARQIIIIQSISDQVDRETVYHINHAGTMSCVHCSDSTSFVPRLHLLIIVLVLSHHHHRLCFSHQTLPEHSRVPTFVPVGHCVLTTRQLQYCAFPYSQMSCDSLTLGGERE